MIGRILFLSAVSFAAYKYISKSNRKAREIQQKAGVQEILPPEPQLPPVEESAVVVQRRPRATETDPLR